MQNLMYRSQECRNARFRLVVSQIQNKCYIKVLFTLLTSTSFGWGKGGNATSVGWQVILCDPIWHVRVPVALRRLANCYTPFTFTLRLRNVVILHYS